MGDPRTALLRLAEAVRFDSLFWRRFAHLGSVYGPEWWKTYSPAPIAAVVFLVAARNRRGAIANLRRVLGSEAASLAPRMALRTFVQFAHCMSETMEYYSPRREPVRVDAPGRDVLAGILAAGRGAVVVTGHLGNWDIAARTLCDYGCKVNVVMAREVNATTHEYVRLAREQAGVKVIYSDASVFSSLGMIHALRQNEIVALQLDRSPGRVRMVPFFGAPAPFPTGPFALARLSGAPLLPVFVPRLGRRHYAIRLGKQFRFSEEARDPHALDLAMAEAVREFEAIVREFPDQWFQFAPYWRSSGPAASSAGQEGDEAEAEQPRRAG
jgi:lauroyl/myristoyl acyltransferase